MLKKLLGAAAMAGVAFAVVPASAAKMAGCSGENLEKTESAIDAMADGAGKIVAQKEVDQSARKIQQRFRRAEAPVTQADLPFAGRLALWRRSLAAGMDLEA